MDAFASSTGISTTLRLLGYVVTPYGATPEALVSVANRNRTEARVFVVGKPKVL